MSKDITVKLPELEPDELIYFKTYLKTLSHLEAHRAAKPTLKKHSSNNPYFRSKKIQTYISSAMVQYCNEVDITPSAILELIYEEATNQDNPSSSRLQALGLLARYAGLFEKEEKDPNTGTIINIINYNNPEVKEEKEVKIKKENKVLEDKDTLEFLPLPNIKTTTYSTPKVEGKNKED